MEENKEKSIETLQKASLKSRLENFWYHYKWHTVITAFIVFVIALVSVQLITKADYDVYVLYAGDHKISNLASDGDLPEHQRIVSSLGRVCDDRNGDGSIDVNLQNLYVLSAEQRGALGSDNTSDLSLTLSDTKTFENMLVVGNYYLCFVSEEVFFETDAIYDGAIFEPLEKYATDESIDYEYASPRGIYLRSLPFAQFIDLPDDTVVCLRALNGYSAEIGKKQNTKSFATGEAAMKKILTYK